MLKVIAIVSHLKVSANSPYIALPSEIEIRVSGGCIQASNVNECLLTDLLSIPCIVPRAVREA